MADEYKIYTDGASRGNPGESGIGVIIYKNGNEFLRYKQYLGIMTNNQAEYLALIKALKIIEEMQIIDADLFLDSQLLVKQMRGEYKVKAPNMIPLYKEARNLTENKNLSFNWIKREENTQADSLANEAIDNKTN
jgi:ribonuclease HI